MAIESFEDLTRHLRDHPEWQAQLRSLVLTDDLLELPATVAQRMEAVDQRLDRVAGQLETLAGMVDRLADAQERTEVRLQGLADAQERTEVRLQGLAEQLSTVGQRTDRAIGYLVEQQYRLKAHAYFQRIARRLHVLTPEELDQLLDTAIADGTMQDWQAEQIRWTDAVIHGRREGEQVLLVVEASALVARDDVERAAQRAEYLAATGVATIGIAAGERTAPTAALLARESGVWVVTNGHVEEPTAA